MYTLEEINKHNKKNDCWTAINGGVYDITPFVNKHPGGLIIAMACGKDASYLYNSRPNTAKKPHPAAADQMLKKLYLGKLNK